MTISLITASDIFDLVPFVLLWSIGIMGLAYYLGHHHGRTIGELIGRNLAEQGRAALLMRAKTEGMFAERARWIAKQAKEGRFDLKPRQQILGCEKCGPNFLYGSSCPHEEDGLHRGKLFYADTGEPVPVQSRDTEGNTFMEPPADWLDVSQHPLIAKLDQMIDGVRQNCNPNQP